MLIMRFIVLVILTALNGVTTVQPADNKLKHLEVNATDLSYTEAGSGQPLIFVHGSTNDFRGWGGQMAPFSEHFHVIAYSRRYHHPNRWNLADVPYTMQQHAADLIAFIDTLGLKRVILIGHSYGASVALLAATKRPEMVSKLVLAEPLMMLPNSAGESLQADRSAVQERVREAFAAGDSVRAFSEFSKWMEEGFPFEQLPEAVRERLLSNALSFKLQVDQPFKGYALTCADLQKIDAPCLMVEGEWTKPYFKLATNDIAACLPMVHRTKVPRAGHGSAIQNPEGFNKVVLEFLTLPD